jgi:hypothetical protein
MTEYVQKYQDILKLAAKAAGIEVEHWSKYYDGGFLADRTYWCPTERLDQAFDLALRLNIFTGSTAEYCVAWRDGENVVQELVFQSKHLAMCLAVVKTAARVEATKSEAPLWAVFDPAKNGHDRF